MDENQTEQETQEPRRGRDWRTYVIIAVSCVAILAIAAGIALAVTGNGSDAGRAPEAAGRAALGARGGSQQGDCGACAEGRNGTCDGECDENGTRDGDCGSGGTGACTGGNCAATGQSVPAAGACRGSGQGQGCCENK